jgi:methyl-accepting chemotaxis protein
VREISDAAENLRQGASEVARAMEEQTKGVRGVTTSTANVAKQIKSISGANKSHLANASIILQKVRSANELSAKNPAASKQPRQAGERSSSKQPRRPNGQGLTGDSSPAHSASK